MEHAAVTDFTDQEDESPAISSDGSVTLLHADEAGKDTKISPEMRGSKIDPDLDAEERYSQQRVVAPKLRDFNPSTHSHTEQFIEMMKTFQNSTKGSKTMPLSLGGTHSWDEVFRIVKDIETVYHEAGQSGIRRIGRSIGNQSESMMSFLKFIPNGFYESTAASQIAKGREKVLDTILRIPDLILQAEHSLETFYPDPTLYDKAEELYLAILRAIEAAAAWLTQHPLGKQGRALARGKQYNNRFNEKVKDLDDAIIALQTRVSVLRDEAIVTTKRTTDNVETMVNKVAVTGTYVASRADKTLHKVRSLQREAKDLKFAAEHNDAQLSFVAEGIETFKKSQDKFDNKIDIVHAAQQTAHVKLRDLHGGQEAINSRVETMSDVQQAKEQAARAVAIALETAGWRKKTGRTIRRMKEQIKILENAANGLSQADLLEILDVSPEAPIEDFRRIHRACQSIDPSDYQIAQGVFEGAKFKEWLSADVSDALLIEGGPALATHGRFASLSLTSCLAIECLDDKDPAATIFHFCRRHTFSKDPLQGPQGLMRSLICQVLRLFQNEIKLGFTATTFRRYQEQLESYNLQTLCDCFAKVVRQLPREMVLFCIIDGIDSFEKHDWAESCRFMIRELQDILYEYECGPVFKLLVTSPVRSRHVGDTFHSRYRLLLSRDGSSGRNDPTEREKSKSRGARRPKARESDAFRSLRTAFPEGGEESSDGSSDSDFSWSSDPA
ncbi:hypothetical protein H2200_000422 [Cladophialophora chaetospira]|uniref:Nephrocystin 3-like N-terminal domain-containing protein n=1 Tax=Cladophialophora chaetospira TaxID=386627 RepID=A0AA39CQX5_9EURO|nr:hypothetical protein H2200_000422 [Cladophialophora chaetospira]